MFKKTKFFTLALLIISAGAVQADNEVVGGFDQNTEIEAAQDTKSSDYDFDAQEEAEFEDLDSMVNKMDDDDFPEIVPQPWWRQALISIGASLYMQYRAWHKWMCGTKSE